MLQQDNEIEILRGSTKTIEYTVLDQDGNFVDLTGSTLFLTVKRDMSDTIPVFVKTNKYSGPDVQITNPKGGLCRFTIRPADTQSLDIRQYYFDIWVILSNGNRYPVIPPTVFDVQAGVTSIP